MGDRGAAGPVVVLLLFFVFCVPGIELGPVEKAVEDVEEAVVRLWGHGRYHQCEVAALVLRHSRDLSHIRQQIVMPSSPAGRPGRAAAALRQALASTSTKWPVVAGEQDLEPGWGAPFIGAGRRCASATRSTTRDSQRQGPNQESIRRHQVTRTRARNTSSQSRPDLEPAGIPYIGRAPLRLEELLAADHEATQGAIDLVKPLQLCNGGSSRSSCAQPPTKGRTNSTAQHRKAARTSLGPHLV